MERLPSLPSASLFLFLSLLSIGLDLSRPCKREGGRSEGERELAVGWGGDRSVMSPESGESPGKVIGALDVLNVQISAKKCALALPGGAGMEAALRPLCKVQEPAPGCFTSRPGCCGGGGRAGGAALRPQHLGGLQSLAGAPLRRARGARWGGRRRRAPRSPACGAPRAQRTAGMRRATATRVRIGGGRGKGAGRRSVRASQILTSGTQF